MNIQRVTFRTTDLQPLRAFYEGMLGLPLFSESASGLCFDAGFSKLCFQKQDKATPYHFAFHTRIAQLEESADKLKEKDIRLLPFRGKEFVDFPAWNARSIYFHDPDNNIVELIGRRRTEPVKPGDHSGLPILGLAEVGLATYRMNTTVNKLKEEAGLPVYDGSTEVFCAIGDANGLFICIDAQEKKWIPLNEKAFPSEFTVELDCNNKELQLSYDGNDLVISG